MTYPSLFATLVTNTITSAIAGTALLLAPGPIAGILGDVPVWLCQAVGAGLLLFAAGVICAARQLPSSGRYAAWVLALDIAWVIATPVVLIAFFDQISRLGAVLLLATAGVVTVFALLQRYWLAQMRRATPSRPPVLTERNV